MKPLHIFAPAALAASCLAGILGSALAWWPASAALAGGSRPDEPPRWYKGNTHAHSLWSDGDDFPEMIVDWYRKRDYDFLALSDHNILADHERWLTISDVVRRAQGDDVMTKYEARFGDGWVEKREHDGRRQVRLKQLAEFRGLFEKPGEFLLIPAEEITDGFAKRPIHVNAVNIAERIDPPHGDSARATMRNILRTVREQAERTGRPILAHLNHPNFGWGVTAEDLAHVIEEDFFEVYNGHPGINHLGDETHASDERIWDIANTIRIAELKAPPLYGVATDDSHTYHGRSNVTPGRGWVMVRARELSPAALIEAMRRGDFYASSGVTLREVRYSPETKKIEIEIAPDGDATFTTEFIGTRSGFDARSEPARGENGEPRDDITRRYSSDVGAVLARVEGLRAGYTLTGDELYVRATITSSAPAGNPSFDGQRKQAWTQPVGWEERIRKSRAADNQRSQRPEPRPPADSD